MDVKDAGKLGGLATSKKYPNHLKEISRLGVEARKRKKTQNEANIAT